MEKYWTKATDRFHYALFSLVENEIDLSSTVTMVNLVDATNIDEARRSKGQDAPTYTAILALLLAKTLIEMPQLNVRWYRPFGFLPRRLQYFTGADIGIASEVKDPNLHHVAYVAVMPDVEKMSLSEISAWLKRYRNTESVPQWQAFSGLVRRVPPLLARVIMRLPVYFPSMWSRYRGGAALISSPAKYGVDQIAAAWSSPIGVSFGFVKARPIVKNGVATACPSFYLTFNFDRRILSGADGARFLKRLTEHLESFGHESDRGLIAREAL